MSSVRMQAKHTKSESHPKPFPQLCPKERCVNYGRTELTGKESQTTSYTAGEYAPPHRQGSPRNFNFQYCVLTVFPCTAPSTFRSLYQWDSQFLQPRRNLHYTKEKYNSTPKMKILSIFWNIWFHHFYEYGYMVEWMNPKKCRSNGTPNNWKYSV